MKNRILLVGLMYDAWLMYVIRCKVSIEQSLFISMANFVNCPSLQFGGGGGKKRTCS
jgi:hypothetical protein